DATIAEVRGFALAQSAAAGHPARTLRRRCAAEIATKPKVNVGRVFRENTNLFAIGIEFGPWRQGRGIHTYGVIADGGHPSESNPQAISVSATGYGTSDAHFNSTGGRVVWTGDPDLDKARISRQATQGDRKNAGHHHF